jgi:predicted small secreted protein
MRLRIAIVMVLALLVALVAGCKTASSTGSAGQSDPASIEASATDEALPTDGTDGAAEGELSGPPMSGEELIPFIRGMGISHKGEKLWVIVRSIEKSEAAATQKLIAAFPIFGDLVTYYVIEPTEHLQGLKAGGWAIVEAYRDKPAADSIELGKRGAPDAQVVQVTITCDDPIPVFEDQMGGLDDSIETTVP